MNEQVLIEVLFWALVALNVADVWLTNEVLRMGGSELNKLVIWLMDKLGREVGLILPKAVALGAVGWAIFFSGEPTGNQWYWLAAAGAVYVYAFGVNLRNYLDMKKNHG